MALTSKVSEQTAQQNRVPGLYKSNITDQIILATSYNPTAKSFTGVVLQGGDTANYVGYFSDNFTASLFKPFIGDVLVTDSI